MNKRDVTLFLAQYFSNYLLHDRFLSELVSMIAGSGYEAAFWKILLKQLHILSVLGIQVTATKEFELIGDGIFSMHLTGRGFNVRALFCFMPNSQPAFLVPFFERAGKGKTDYSSYISTAQTRKHELEEVFHRDR